MDSGAPAGQANRGRGRGRPRGRGRGGRPIVAPERYRDGAGPNAAPDARANPPAPAADAAGALAGGAVPGVAAPAPAVADAGQIAALNAMILQLQQQIHQLREAPPRVHEPAPLPVQPVPAVPEVTPQFMLTLRKMLMKYDGKLNYDVFRHSFEDVVKTHPQLTDQHKFELLSSTLHGEAQSVLEDLGDNRSYAALDDALKVAYSRPIHAWTELRSLPTLKQNADESIEA